LETETSEAQKHLKRFFGFNHFKGNQESVVENVLAGKDSFVIMPTGGGKSLCYQLPAIMQSGG
jgi:ATP-dependent DNA helicase RecQ